MSLELDQLRILYYPEPVLRRPALPIEHIDEQIHRLAERMIELMYEARGVGLAAPQVGHSVRLFVAHVPPDPDESVSDHNPPTATAGPQVYINPRLVEPVGPPELREEGCLSIPEVTGEVYRSPQITIEALDLSGQPIRQTGAGLLARCWQHEFDHLEGVLIIDRMTQRSRLRNRATLRALERRADRPNA